MNPKRGKAEAEYRKLKSNDAQLQTCKVCGQRDAKRNMEPHHPAGRAGDNLFNYFWTHPACHRWIHENQAEAERLGLLTRLRNIIK